MSNKCKSTTNLFQEAIDHCRWKKVLYFVLKQINLSEYENKTFEEIIIGIYDICKEHNGIGMLTIYDISAAICRFYKRNIDKVYIIGNGPKRAVRLLNLKPKTHKINGDIAIKYLEINEVINGFDSNSFELDTMIRNITNGDIVETYICNWQKTQ
jgi:hypothetical protein